MDTQKTFVKEVTYLAIGFDPSKMTDTETGVSRVPVKKAITFQDLDQCAREQHKFHFKLISLYTNASKKEGFGSEEDEIVVDTSDIYDLVVEFLKKFAVLDEKFTDKDREELMNDFGAMASLSMWLMPEKFYPFFADLRPHLEM